jgi:hypothetical protein
LFLFFVASCILLTFALAKEKKEKKPRAPSAYNEFMKTELPKVKKEHPGLKHSEAFAKAASNVSYSLSLCVDLK